MASDKLDLPETSNTDEESPGGADNASNKKRRVDFSSNICDVNSIEKYRELRDSIRAFHSRLKTGEKIHNREIDDLHCRVCNFVNPSFDPDEDKITFADVEGWDSLKEILRDRISPPPPHYKWLHEYRDPSKEAEYRMKFNLTLFGPPGTGM